MIRAGPGQHDKAVPCGMSHRGSGPLSDVQCIRGMRKLIPVLLIAAAACGRQSSPMDEALQRDLQAASAGTIELAPRMPGTQVVSAIESKRPPAEPRVAPVRRASGPAPAPESETPQPTRTAESNEPTAKRPTTTPAVQPPPPGGYKTVGEVIRNAPFPIKP